MHRIQLGKTGIESSSLGFGCVSLTMHDNRRKAVALLEEALALGTDHVDLPLLHECTLAEASRDDLRAFLDEQVKKGRVRACGTATAYDALGGDAAPWPADYHVLQFDSSALTPHVRELKNVGD